MTARLQRDDGAVVYLNGAEVWRNNLPTGTITNLTRANATVSGTNETNWITTPLSPGLLLSGTNVIAVEIHQDSTNSSDIAFDFELAANVSVSQPPTLQGTLNPGALTLAWPAGTVSYAVQTTTNLTPPVTWLTLTNSPTLGGTQWQLTLPLGTNRQTFYRLRSQP